MKNNIKNSNKETVVASRIAGETNNQILAVKAKHEEEKERFEMEIKMLQERLKERDDPVEFDDKNFNDNLNDNKNGPGIKGEAFANPIEILKQRVKKILAVNKEKKKLIDLYSKNAMILKDAFQQISDSSGISNIEEIVTTFIKAEEQNYSLYNYVNMLGQETDAIEENNKFLDSEIEKYKLLNEKNEQEK